MCEPTDSSIKPPADQPLAVVGFNRAENVDNIVSRFNSECDIPFLGLSSPQLTFLI